MDIHRISPARRSALVQAWGQGLEAASYVLQLKLCVWQQLPQCLCGLTHPSAAKAHSSAIHARGVWQR
eukprot:4664360-Alexandrium_andersonii.AAC.1